MNRARTLACAALATLVALNAAAQSAPPSAKPATPTPAPAVKPPAAPAKPAEQPPSPAAKPGPAPGSPAPASPAGAPPAAPPAAQAPGGKMPSPAYTYNPEGRRDPFLSLVGRGNDTKGARPTGVAGLLINELSIKGIIRDRGGYVAMIQGSDNKTYVVKAGDRLMDGTVKSILQDGVVFSQDVSDPLSLIKQKEIRKTLRTIEGGRG